MAKKWISTASLLGALCVILGAFGAHALKERLEPAQLANFETGVRYQFYHVFGILAVGLIALKYENDLLNWAGRLFIAGILFFSGSLYLLSTRNLIGLSDNYRWLGPITPIGGVCFISGWILLFYSIQKMEGLK